MTNIEINTELIAYCGLYCGACRKYIKGKCPGCKKNEKAKWCKVRTCNMENKFASCADCNFHKPEDCKKLNNFMAKLFSIVFRSDRNACINNIKTYGYDRYAREMAEKNLQTIKRR